MVLLASLAAACGGTDGAGDNDDGSTAIPDTGFNDTTDDASDTGTEPEADAITDIGDNDGPDAPDTTPSNITISALLPPCGPTTGGTSVIVSGTGFGSGAQVQLDGSEPIVGLGTPGSVAFETPEAATAGRVDVTVIQDSDQNTLANGFYYHRAVTWQTRTIIPTEFSELISVGDIDGDGLDDLVQSQQAAVVIQSLADQEGVFTSTVTNTACATPSAVLVSDVAGDDVGDIIIGCGTSIQVIVGADGGGLTTGPLSATNASGGNFHLEMASVDLNGDGTNDLAVRSQGRDTVQVFTNDGTGAFTPAGEPFETGDDLTGLRLGDFNSDGNPDLMTAHFGLGLVRVRPGNGDGTFGAPVDSEVPGVQTLSLLDANDDTILDLGVGSNNGSVGASIYAGNGDGSFSPLKVVQNGGLISAALLDMDADGLADIIVGDGTEFRIYLDALADAPACRLTAPIPDAMFALIPGEFNGDGITDVVGFNRNQRVFITAISQELPAD
jgi:hypothetical protein